MKNNVMKKIVSIGLSVAISMSVCTTKTYAIGYNKVVDNELGGKTTYVDTEHLEDYMKKLKAEMEKVKEEYENKYQIHPWKGFLMELSPILLATVFNISLSFAMKLFNYNRFKKSLKVDPIDFASSSDSSTSSSRETTPVCVRNNTKGFWKNSSLSLLQNLFLGVISGVTLFLGLVKSKDYTPLSQSFKATDIWEKNKWILDDLTDAINDPEQTVRLYGAEIVCSPADFLDKINKKCTVNSQEYLFDHESPYYDPNLANEIPKLSN